MSKKWHADDTNRYRKQEAEDAARGKAAKNVGVRVTNFFVAMGSGAPVGMLGEHYIPSETVEYDLVEPEPVTEKHVQVAYKKLCEHFPQPERSVTNDNTT